MVEPQPSASSAPPEPWARTPSESSRAYEAADAYFALGPGRSLVKVGEALGKSRALCERWSRQHSWVERAAAWDERAVALQRERDHVERSELRREMLQRHSRLGRQMTQAAESGLMQLEPTALSAAEVARLADTGSRLERRSRGEPLGLTTSAQAQGFVDGLLDVAMRFIDDDRQEMFLAEIEARCGEAAS